MRIAVIADIHGNAAALEAVLADIQSRAVDLTINLGDIASGPLWPRETLELLARHPMLTVRGNHDRWVSGPDPAGMGASDRFAHRELADEQRAWLGGLPVVADVAPGVLAFHAAPADDNRYLVEDVHDGRLVQARPAAIRDRIGNVEARIVLCGHSHLPHLLQLQDGPLVLNPGSVGCPAYDDPGADEPHVSEAGSPHARYATMTITDRVADVDLIAVDYPWETAARRAEDNGRPEWAYGLRTGFMPRAE